MERTKETLEARVRETPLVDRLKECQQRIGNMCAELRGPKMSIPVEYYDDDFYICTTLADAQAQIETLQAQLEQEREKVKGLEHRVWELEGWPQVKPPHEITQMEVTIERLATQLSQLQALVRALPVVRIDLNGAYHDTLLAQPEDEVVKELLRYRAGLDATTPATTKT